MKKFTFKQSVKLTQEKKQCTLVCECVRLCVSICVCVYACVGRYVFVRVDKRTRMCAACVHTWIQT